MRFKHAIPVSLILAAWVTPAFTTYHTFRISEIYSNASGNIQFIELHESFNSDFEEQVSLAPNITSGTQSFTFLTNLPSTSTANKSFLLGTSAYAAIPGAPAPDYIIPSNFFNRIGDTLTYGTSGPDGIVDPTTFGALPAGATLSLNRIGTFGNSYSTATNSPTDFAGATGSIPEPSSLPLVCVAGGLALRARRRKIG